MTTNAIPEEGEVAEKKVCSASAPPAEAPMPTTGKLSAALNEWSTGAATSSAPPEGVSAEPSPRFSVDDIIWSWPLPVRCCRRACAEGAAFYMQSQLYPG